MLEIYKMQQLPSPPTDNLYKFLSITGITIFLLSVIYPNTRTTDINLKKINVEAERSALIVELKRLNADFTSLEREYEELAKEKKYLDDQENPTQYEINEYNNKISSNSKKYEKTKAKSDEIDIKNAKIEAKQKEVDYLAKELDFYTTFFVYGASGGLSLALVGFLFWFFLVQHQQDLLLDYEQKNKQYEYQKNYLEYQEKKQEYLNKLKIASMTAKTNQKK